MTDTQRGVILLLKSAITGQSYPLPDGFDLEKAAAIARKHHILPLVYTGAVSCGISSKEPFMQSLFLEYLRILMRSEAQQEQIRRICTAFEENGIDYLPLKGCNLKQLYPKPELRVMGDADILIRMEQYGKIRPIMESLGFTEKNESDHELVWDSTGLHLELHKRIIPTYDRDLYAYFGDGWSQAKNAGLTRYAMDPEDEFIFLFSHLTKHYRYGGVGCRHVLDLWVWRRAHPDMDEERIRAALGRMQLLRFYDHIRAMIGNWFEDGPESHMSEYLTEFILSCGSWGTADRMLQSIALRNARNHGTVRGNRAKSILRSLFPPVSVMGQRYPIVNRLPWLLPAFWPVRWVTALLFRRENIRRERKFQKTVSPEQVRAREEALRYVGLDFHF